MPDKRFSITAALLLSALWGGFLGSLHLTGSAGFLDRMEATLTDFRSVLIGRKTPPQTVAIVAIDDRTAASHGYPVDRATLARAVTTVAALRPKTIALDLLFIDPSTEQGDSALVSALRLVPSVIAAAAVFPQSTQTVASDPNDPLAGIPFADSLLLPLKRFSDVAATGVVNVATDETGVPRFMPLISRSDGRVDPSFALRTASLALDRDPAFQPGSISFADRHIPTDTGQRLPLTFYGPRGTIPTFSLADALDGKVPQDAIENRVVIFGSTVTAGGDVFPTPFDPVLPGVEVISTAIAHLIAGDSIVRDHNIRRLDATVAVLLPLALVGLIAWRRSIIGFALIVLVLVTWATVNLAMFRAGYWLSASLPIAAALPPVLAFGAAQLLLGRRQARLFAAQSELLQRVEAPGLGEWLARDPSFLAVPVRQNAAVVFIDLSGFTGLSEAVGAVTVREILSGFFEIVDEEARAHGGAITSFMGDGAMILFGLPHPADDDASRAAACALALADRMGTWLNSHADLQGERRIGFKIGAHCGPVVASRLGTGDRQQITATGDTVNVASRLMEVAASRGAEVAFSAALVRVASSDGGPLPAGPLEGPLETHIRGRSGSIDVWLWRPAT
ncbi:CHASE2 domain-containing protein [Rhizobium sullae]|uniref:Adenylate cyclase n=1 Tax=Rhizobium sullae TaxID=50338 RepID=A0A4R3PTT6_RHISU|nr:adenylate/guanylate cyclase domain-containing protein [Rhizobium sullae]TCU09951.1 adenylate cyclase [Rhizobium sullae]